MTTNVSVLIPYAGDDEHRARALAWVTRRYHALGWQICIGETDQPGDRFVKADAVARALEDADHATLVIADADCWSPATPRIAAEIDAGHPWGVPHRLVHRLAPIATQALYDDLTLEPNPRFRPLRVYRGVIGGGIVVIRRDVYDRTPLDPRFVGWGGEDDAFGWALQTLEGLPKQGEDRCYHLWHPAPPRVRRHGSLENNSLAGAYKDRRPNADAMRQLVEEGKCQSRTSSSIRSPSSSPA